MKRLLSFFLSFLLIISPVLAQSTGSGTIIPIGDVDIDVPVITSMSTQNITPGTIIELSGLHFQNAPGIYKQVCFSESQCTSDTSFDLVVLGWTDSKITLQVPNWNIPLTGTISLLVPLSNGQNFVWVDSPLYIFNTQAPIISSTSPTNAKFEETIITIKGQYFSDSYTPGYDQICFGESCILDAAIATYLVSWSDSEIKVKVPSLQNVTSTPITLQIWDYDNEYDGQANYHTVQTTPISFEVVQNPQIISLNPRQTIPGETTITIQGTGFGENYRSGENQICFSLGCIADQHIPLFLLKWSDTEIQLTAPSFLNDVTTSTLSLRLYHPIQGIYQHVEATDSLTITNRPEIRRYYPKMETGGTYTIEGSYFGSTVGKVYIDQVELHVRSWTNSTITFAVPKNATSGDLTIYSAKNVTSQPLAVTVVYIETYSNDFYSSNQWYLGAINIENAWSKTTGSSDVVVAVIDSGVDMNHEDLIGSFWRNTGEIPNNNIDDDQNGYVDDINGWNFVENSNNLAPLNDHGTMVAGLISANKDNNIGIAGIAPGVQLMNLQVTSPADSNFNEDYITFAAVQQAVKYAVDNGADIINFSFGTDTMKGLYAELVQYAYDNNVIMIAAAGNFASDLDTFPFSPICDEVNHNDVIGVSSLDESTTKSEFSSYGMTCIDVSAPGGEVITTSPAIFAGSNPPYSIASGTSFATPIVSGVAALIKSLHPDWNVAEVHAALKASTRSIQSANPLLYQKLGTGIIDASIAVKIAKPSVTYEYKPTTFLEISDQDVTIAYKPPVNVKPINKKEEQITLIDESLTGKKDGIDTVSDTSTNTTNDVLGAPFPDVSIDNKNIDAITYLKEKSILQGYPDGTFQPYRAVNRAEFLKIVFEARGITIPDSFNSCFIDVQNEWFAKYVCYAKALGIVEGYPDPNLPSTRWEFRPARTINKVEALKIVLNTFGEATSTSLSSFRDVPVNAWFTPYVVSAEALNLLEELGSDFLDPGSLMQRGGISEIVYRLLYLREMGLVKFSKG